MHIIKLKKCSSLFYLELLLFKISSCFSFKIFIFFGAQRETCFSQCHPDFQSEARFEKLLATKSQIQLAFFLAHSSLVSLRLQVSSRKSFRQKIPFTFVNRIFLSNWCPERDLNSHTVRQRLLRPSCLPFHHLGRYV